MSKLTFTCSACRKIFGDATNMTMIHNPGSTPDTLCELCNIRRKVSQLGKEVKRLKNTLLDYDKRRKYKEDLPVDELEGWE